jgi:hypothetical protein
MCWHSNEVKDQEPMMVSGCLRGLLCCVFEYVKISRVT